jgi:hypothetical protein
MSAKLDKDDLRKIRDLGDALAEDHEWEALSMDLRQLLAQHDLPCTKRAETELRDHIVWLLS